MAVKVTKASISTATDTNPIPEPCVPNEFGDNISTPIQLITCIIQTGCLANVIHLSPTKMPIIKKAQSAFEYQNQTMKDRSEIINIQSVLYFLQTWPKRVHLSRYDKTLIHQW